MKKYIIILRNIILILVIVSLSRLQANNVWYYPSWAQNAKYNESIKVLDTQSALGRYAQKTKEITLKDLALIHGHLCDGLVISYVEIKEVLKKLFPDGAVDRTDLRVVSKNGPCWVDVATMMTGARVNFKTLSIQPEIGDGFIIQKISTGEAYSVHLKNGIFPNEQAELEYKIRSLKKEGKPVLAEDIDRVEKMHNELSKMLLNTHPDNLLDIKKLDNYNYTFNFETTNRGDIINKNAAR